MLHFFKSNTNWIIKLYIDGGDLLQRLRNNSRKRSVSIPKILLGAVIMTFMRNIMRIESLWTYVIRTTLLSWTKSFESTLSCGSVHWNVLNAIFRGQLFQIDIWHHKPIRTRMIRSFMGRNLLNLIILVKGDSALEFVWIKVTSCLLTVNLHLLYKSSNFSGIYNVLLVSTFNSVTLISNISIIFHEFFRSINSYFLHSHPSCWLNQISLLILYKFVFCSQMKFHIGFFPLLFFKSKHLWGNNLFI